ncbi:MAG: ABC transporter ATP-binding protein [Anaerolineae bacterium]|nr:ABC transporter ATP-binding protein [Anaerolineae bacterium]
MSLLEVRDLFAYRGTVLAVKGVSLAVEQGEIVALLGGNGAGKSTLLHSICGLISPVSGQVIFAGESMASVAPHQRAHQGLVLAPQGRRIFSRMTVHENLLMGAYGQRDRHLVKDRMNAVLGRFPRLGERFRQFAGTLSGGEQQMLVMARALMARPSLLLLDEPSLGLAPALTHEIYDVIRMLPQEGITVLLADQNSHLALSIAQRGYILRNGIVFREGNAQQLQRDTAIAEAYLGSRGRPG